MLECAVSLEKICSSIASSSDSSCVDHRHVAVDHRIDQRVEHEARAVLQQLRLAFGTAAHAEEALLAAVAHRQHVVGADEDVDLAHVHLAGAERGSALDRLQLDQLQHGEQRVAVLLDLRPLVAVTRVLDRELVQPELLLHGSELLGRGVLERHPDEAVAAADPASDLLDRNVLDPAPLLVHDAVDEHRFSLVGVRSCLLPGWPGKRQDLHRSIAQHSMTFTARPPRAVSLYLVCMSAPVSRIVLITWSSDT